MLATRLDELKGLSNKYSTGEIRICNDHGGFDLGLIEVARRDWASFAQYLAGST